MSVSLESDTQNLEDVVVIGYGVAKKTDLTGSVTAIKPDEKNHGVVTNAQDMIAGKIAGVNVTSNSGTPGGGATIRIRGGSSLNASNDPLIVIDGLAMDNNGVKGLSNPLSMVNPADIESFTVLKDASATAIYGSRGSNGVIIITTKKGLKGQKPKLTYNGNISFAEKKKTIDVMDGDEYREFVTNLYGADSEVVGLLGTSNTDWQDEIYRVALGTDHNLTVSGGGKNLTYRVSAGFTGQQGILDTSDFRRTTVSFNLSPSWLDNHLLLSVNGKGMIAKTVYADTDAVGAAVWMDPTQPVKAADDPKYNAADYEHNGGYWQWNQGFNNDATWPTIYNSQATKNPVALLDQKDDKATSKSIIGNLDLTYKIHGLEDLILHATYGIDASTGKQTTDITPLSSTNAYYGYNGWSKTNKYNTSFNATIMYTHDFEKNHFDIMAGYEWQHFHSESTWDGSGMYPETYGSSEEDVAKRGTAYQRDANGSKTENYLVSWLARGNWSLINPGVMLTATLRYDGSSRFRDHWALFPAVALGWKFTNIIESDVFTEGKIRLGWGKTGQQEGIGDYNYQPTYSVSTGKGSKYPIFGDGTMYRPNVYNKDLSWETTTTWNVGLDLGFFNDRLSFSGDYYYRETTDLINTVYVSAGSNFRNQMTSNVGKLENKGVELALTGRPIAGRDWNWEISLNATYNKNEVTELIGQEGYYVETGGISAGTGNNCQAHTVGMPVSSFHVYQQVYDEATGLPLEGVYVDRNGDGQITVDDKYYYKSPAAPWTLGLSTKLQWRHIDLGVGMRGSIGNYVFNDQDAGMSNCGKGAVYNLGYLSNRRTDVLARNWQTYDNPLSDYFVQNASFFKLDNITLGYSFDHIGGAKLGGRVYASCTNVACKTNYKGIDPEVSGGIDNNIYPRPITTLIGLTLTF